MQLLVHADILPQYSHAGVDRFRGRNIQRNSSNAVSLIPQG